MFRGQDTRQVQQDVEELAERVCATLNSIAVAYGNGGKATDSPAFIHELNQIKLFVTFPSSIFLY